MIEKELKFPLLTTDQIECRVGQVSEKGFTLLLYKDARCDMNILDSVVGASNWCKKYYQVKDLVICSLGIYFEDRHEWVWKDDTGSAGSIEEEKSICSDAQKRACVCWGIGRELYTAPFIWIKADLGYNPRTNHFFVKEIAYNDKKEISKLVICEEKSKEVAYSFGSNERPTQPKPSVETPKPQTSGTKISDENYNKIINHLNGVELYEQRVKFLDYMNRHYGTETVGELTNEQATELIKVAKI